MRRTKTSYVPLGIWGSLVALMEIKAAEFLVIDAEEHP